MSYFIHDFSPIILDIDLHEIGFRGFAIVFGILIVIFLISYFYKIFSKTNVKFLAAIYPYFVLIAISFFIIFIFAPTILSLRYYGVLFGVTVLLAWIISKYIFKKRKYNILHLDNAILHCIFGVVIGMRLGHVLFYNPSYYFEDIIRIFKVWEGGLASHGAFVGGLIGIFIFARKNGYSFNSLIDIAALAVAPASVLIRIGNFMNSEIVGRITDFKWAVVFVRYDYPQFVGKIESLPENLIARHPSQIYEAFFGLLIIFLLVFLYVKRKNLLPNGALFYVFLLVYSLMRFFVEFFKEYQALGKSFLTMGQYLTIPFFLFSLIMLFRLYKKT